MAKRANNHVITEIAPCGLLCSRCESFMAGKCSGCYSENARNRTNCQVTDGEPFEETKKLILCMRGMGVEQCLECELFDKCDIYEAMLLKCPFKAPIYHIKPGFTYLVLERKPDLSFKVFKNLVKHGAQGLCISRQHPKNLQNLLITKDFETYWLTSLEGKGNIDPTNLGIISDIIIRFIEGHNAPVIILDGIELLFTSNDFLSSLRMVNHLSEQMMQHNASFIIPIDDRTLDEKELALLERNMEVFRENEP